MVEALITEANFQDTLIAYARLKGWRVAGFRRARTKDSWTTPVIGDGAGWPDLIFARPGRKLILAELKSKTGKLTSAQTEWLELLQRIPGIDVKIWKEDDWLEIEEMLK